MVVRYSTDFRRGASVRVNGNGRWWRSDETDSLGEHGLCQTQTSAVSDDSNPLGKQRMMMRTVFHRPDGMNISAHSLEYKVSLATGTDFT